MKLKFDLNHFTVLLSIIFLLSAEPQIKAQDINETNCIRLNTVGYLVNDQKIAVAGAGENLEGQPFYLVNTEESDTVFYTGIISSDRGSQNTPFSYNFVCDFSNFKTSGCYKLKLSDGTLSPSFVIGGLEEYKK